MSAPIWIEHIAGPRKIDQRCLRCGEVMSEPDQSSWVEGERVYQIKRPGVTFWDVDQPESYRPCVEKERTAMKEIELAEVDWREVCTVCEDRLREDVTLHVRETVLAWLRDRKASPGMGYVAIFYSRLSIAIHWRNTCGVFEMLFRGRHVEGE
ncbi:MAG TPA: hypothetical protein VLV83_09175 [Acidobacteriota bacterium]|nr:hypothetical protein [Acidobacteriota bacterium]